jgi:hypothetical protein
MPDVAEVFSNEIQKRYPYAHLTYDELSDLLIDAKDETEREAIQLEMYSRLCYNYRDLCGMYLNNSNNWKESSLEELENILSVHVCVQNFLLSCPYSIKKGEAFDVSETFFVHFDAEVTDTLTELKRWFGKSQDILQFMKNKFGKELPTIDKVELKIENLQSLPKNHLDFLFDVFSYRPDVYLDELKTISELM